ncbi:MAG: redoxin domain-containing protein [Melioribacteraceae bacterium]|nr:redoxin domain-containing protein [Melioribacteraceae bacterium]MCF8264182.1 redoxin domain-containing protein [Melioribacteraceae bacterium]MCF8412651.1 redoxin domain-containing protein [Melioribacteraceae bacterium]MCF8430504.1 redoxin domain-containing protein [Melioribacteraceae bacterium]
MIKSLRLGMIAVISLLTLTSCTKTYEFKSKFATIPEKPNLKETVTVLYSGEGEEIPLDAELKMNVYEFGTDLNSTTEYRMTRSGDGWVSEFTLSDSGYGAVVKFIGEDFEDHNGAVGYIISTYDEDGKSLALSVAGQAQGWRNWFYYVDMDNDIEKAYKLFKKALSLDESIKDQIIGNFISTSYSFNGKSNTMEVENLLAELEKKERYSQTELEVLANWYSRLGMEEKSEQYKSLYNEKYPDGIFAQQDGYSKFRQLADTDEIKAFVEDFTSKYEKSIYKNYMQRTVVSTLSKDGRYEEAYTYNKSLGAEAYNNFNTIAWTIYENDGDLELAAKIANDGIQNLKSELDNPTIDAPEYYSKTEAEKATKQSLANILDTYSTIQEKAGNVNEALESIEQAAEYANFEDGNINTNFARQLFASGNSKSAQEKIEKFIKEGHQTAEMKDILAQVYESINGSTEGYDAYLNKLEKAAQEKMMAELEGKLIEEPAPKFSLSNLEGDEVSLESLKGKTVIVDFWATWCGPCKSSFPGMKIMVEKYSGNDNVRFLFVNTWENVEDKESNASKFINTNNYPFEVLMDNNNKVVADFKVSGIPTKFVIDGEGNIRFKSVGYNGSTDGLVSELDAMISLVN